MNKEDFQTLEDGCYVLCKKSFDDFVANQQYIIDSNDFEHNEGYSFGLTTKGGVYVGCISEDTLRNNFDLLTITQYNVGDSNYSQHKIQPWDIWEDYHLNPWDADIVKRILRTKITNGKTPQQSRIEDYNKIIHICQKRISQIKSGYEY
jgi:hypothetical protein